MNKEQTKKDTVSFFLKKDLLLSPDLLTKLDTINPDNIYNPISTNIKSPNFLVLTADNLHLLNQKIPDISWQDLDQSRVLFEKGEDKKAYLDFLAQLKSKKTEQKEGVTTSVKILFSYKEESKKRTIQDFVSFFNARYSAIEKILRNRQELQNILSINRIINKKDREVVALIGMIKDKKLTSNGNLIFEIEDASGWTKVLVNKNKPELFNLAKEIVLDEIVGIVGANGENIVFANNILWPDIPSNKELKKSPDECYALFLSDFHIGSNTFLPQEFDQFLQWINCKVGSEAQKRIAKNVRYIFIIGDLIDGVGIYPGQDSELLIKDVHKQYAECAKLLKQIPPHIKLIICPGNHDAMRIAEPQPELYKDFAKPIWDLPNIIMVSNPAMVNIHSSPTFPGFDVLLYHGYSFDYYVANVDSIRNQGGYDRADLIMRFLLQRRHLAPTHTSTLYIPEVNKDPLIIDKIPDFFATGHIHNKPIVSNYRNITMLSCGCWQSQTSFQEKVGHNPGPARVPIVNLQTREIKILNFAK